MLAMAKQLRLGTKGRHIFLCADQTQPKCCSKEASIASWNFLKARLKVRPALFQSG